MLQYPTWRYRRPIAPIMVSSKLFVKTILYPLSECKSKWSSLMKSVKNIYTYNFDDLCFMEKPNVYIYK